MAVPARPAPSDDIEDRDPGLARERTDLAWTRTAISFLALGTGMLHTNTIAGVIVVAVGTAVCVVGHLSARSTRGADRRPERGGTVRLITVATTVTAVVALTLALLAPGKG